MISSDGNINFFPSRGWAGWRLRAVAAKSVLVTVAFAESLNNLEVALREPELL
jgi:hypothetical protein